MSDQLLTAVLEIKEMLKLIAEPHLAQRDQKRRTALIGIVGKSAWKRQMVPLLDGTKTQVELRKIIKADQGDLSKFIKFLKEAELLREGEKPHLNLDLPANFFEMEDSK